MSHNHARTGQPGNEPTPQPEFQAFEGPLLDDPYPFFADWVEHSPVFFAPEINYWVISKYNDCRRALKDYEVFSASNTLSPVFPPCPAAAKALTDGGFRSIPTMTNVDPPAHTRTRRIAHQAFTPRRVREMESVVRSIVQDFLESRISGGSSDFVADVAWALPAHIIFSILGLSPDEVASIKAGSSSRLAFMFGKAGEAEQVETAKGMAEFWVYCEDLANDRRVSPQDDFTSDLVHSLDAEGKPLTQQEVSAILFGLLLAGHETTTSLLTNGLRRLLENRESWEALCVDPSLIPGAIEEILRFDSSVVHWRRRTTQDVELSGVTIPADSNVLVAIGAANHDPAKFPNPATFDIRRQNASEHLSFGHGPHTCLGASLARLEARVVLEELNAAAPGLKIVADQRFEFPPIIGFRGPRRLEVLWD